MAKENIDKKAIKINVSVWVEVKEYWRQVEERSIYRIINSQQAAINGLKKNIKLLIGIQGLGISVKIILDSRLAINHN